MVQAPTALSAVTVATLPRPLISALTDQRHEPPSTPAIRTPNRVRHLQEKQTGWETV